MIFPLETPPRRMLAGMCAAVSVATAMAASLFGSSASAESAMELRSAYQRMGTQLRSNQFDRPIQLDSVETGKALTGEIHALVAHPFSGVASTFSDAENWCDIMILHINTKYCRATPSTGGTVLTVRIGSKSPEPLDRATPMDLAFRVVASTADYFSSELTAAKGPLGTSNYRIRLEAIPAGGGKTFLHLTYAYDFGVTSKLAMQAYLATAGRGKVGFTRVGERSDGQPEYVGGMRGAVERNTMRYYLAIDAYLTALNAPAEMQFEKRMALLMDAAERYPRQLNDVDRDSYLAMKRDEYRRQRTGS